MEKFQKTNPTENKTEKLNAWENKLKEIDEWADGTGLGIEDGIKETVVALNLLKFNTIQSCEGHIDSGSTRPWVTVGPYEEPRLKFENQQKIFEETAKKFNAPLEDVVKMRNWEAWQEAWNISSQNNITEEYLKWEKGTDEIIGEIQPLIQEFYRNREVEPYAKITIGGDEGDKLTCVGDDDLFLPISEKQNLTEEQKKKILPKLMACRKEISDFTQFLKAKFLE